MRYVLLISLWLSTMTLGQDLQGNTVTYGYEERPTYAEDLGKKYNPDSLYSHPDFGILPYDKPYQKNVVEDLSQRTAFKRYYIDIDNPNYFYIQKSATPINYEVDNNWVAISPYLERQSGFHYAAINQPNPTRLNISDKTTSIEFNGEQFQFNRYTAEIEYYNGHIDTLNSNWSDIQVGNEAAIISNVFPDMDMKIIFKKGAVKSEFILSDEPAFKSIRFIDNIDLPQGYSIIDTANNQNIISPFLFVKETSSNKTVVKIGQVKIFDSSTETRAWSKKYNTMNQRLSYIIDSTILHADSVAYPLTIDPLITAVGPVSAGIQVSGSLESPAECPNTLNVTFPGGSTPWDVSASWEVYTEQCLLAIYLGFPTDLCFLSEAQVTLESSCGGFSPVPNTNVWLCDAPGCFSSIGNWTPTLPFNSSGTQSLAQCYSPSCSDQTLTYTLDLNRASGCPTFNVGATTYDGCNWGTSLCVRLDTWSVTVQGRTVETLGNTVTGNGSLSLVATSCAGGATTTLDPTPEYGVPGYTYNWSTGETSPTIDVSNFNSGDIFTADVTDACGTTVTATFEINCPLAVDLMSFTAENLDKEVSLNWATASERDNDHFEVLRSTDGEHFQSLGIVEGAGNAATTNYYSFIDTNPEKGINYYKLRIVDFDGVIEYSPIETVNRLSDESSIVCVPNPAKEKVNVYFNFPKDDEYTISIYDMMGKKVYVQRQFFEKGNHSHMINTTSLTPNVYSVQITTGNHVHTSRLIIE